jgi:hypothetical protein
MTDESKKTQTIEIGDLVYRLIGKIGSEEWSYHSRGMFYAVIEAKLIDNHYVLTGTYDFTKNTGKVFGIEDKENAQRANERLIEEIEKNYSKAQMEDRFSFLERYRI